ncbi:DUF6611 family protein [Curtobacterium sp. 9128]|uniref:DUF6611 family protein n=1 Tax=Curtobacterium sp. 9128 TaxID=1793722 RepID=UPI00119F84D6|nr:DUF6611 family protein [Curtobacterium sp. 9128]
MTVTTAAARVLHGPHVWGRLEDRPVTRAMVSSRTLVVFPPGTDTRERLLLGAWHHWFLVGAVVAVAVIAATSASVAGFVAAMVVDAAGFVVLGRCTRRVRPLVRTITVTTFHGYGGPEVRGEVQRLLRAHEALTLAEVSVHSGAIAPAEFEAAWGVVWRSLAPDPC